MTESDDIDAICQRFCTLVDMAVLASVASDNDSVLLYLNEAEKTLHRLPLQKFPRTAEAWETVRKIKEQREQRPCREQSDESDMNGACLRCGAKQGEPCQQQR